MAMTNDYAVTEPSRESINQLEGPTLVEFGAPWCGFCQAAQPLLASALAHFPSVRHIKIEDGRGRPLGRSFRIKLWPTFVFMNNGNEVTRLVRPTSAAAIRDALAQIGSAAEPQA